ncbi:MAG: protein translocase subunit SecDF, partial [Thermoleophilia bacterium]|nr:protein translocase subunit SecDF [Thermoleophilia bacterium]
DTIIVFDRIRENTLLMKKETYADMVDLSIRQTMVRSINTAVATLLPLVAILIFGGPTLKDFALALTIGIASGVYSSFFVAAPLLVVWKEREPRYRKRLLAGREVDAVKAGAAASAVSSAGGAALPGSALSGSPAATETGRASRTTAGPVASEAAGEVPADIGSVRAPGTRKVSGKPRKGKSAKRPTKHSKRTSR